LHGRFLYLIEREYFGLASLPEPARTPPGKNASDDGTSTRSGQMLKMLNAGLVFTHTVIARCLNVDAAEAIYGLHHAQIQVTFFESDARR
jgi:hypothetical protein